MRINKAGQSLGRLKRARRASKSSDTTHFLLELSALEVSVCVKRMQTLGHIQATTCISRRVRA
jgi:hypothetical protein